MIEKTRHLQQNVQHSSLREGLLPLPVFAVVLLLLIKLTHACFAMGVRGRCQEETLPEAAVSSIRNNPFHGWPNESSLSLCGPYTICGVE